MLEESSRSETVTKKMDFEKCCGAPMECQILTVKSVGALNGLRHAWESWPSHRDSDLDFYQMIINSYPDVIRPHVLVLRRDGKPETILVGRLEKKRLAFGIGYLRICRPRVRCLTFVYGAVHGNDTLQNIECLVREVMNSLKRGEADIAMFEFVPVNTLLYRLVLSMPGRLCRDTLPAAQGHDMMLVPHSIDAVYRHMSSDRRIETKRRIRKLENHPDGDPKIVCYRQESELDRLFHDAEEIAKKTYQRGLGAGFADDPLVRQRLALAARMGWLRANLLYIGNKPVAFWIGMLYGRTFVSEYMGYDPDFRQWSPGMVLIMRVIERFCARANGDAVEQLDFGLGHAEYKAALCTKSWSEASVFIFSPTLKGLFLKSTRSVTRILDASARRLLASTSFFPRLKRVWRDRLRKRAKPTSSGLSQPAVTSTKS
jgi:Acetyltransferase (GNAT) domain